MRRIKPSTLVAFASFTAITIFWGVRLSLQPFLDVKEHLTTRWLHAGYHTLSLLFASFTAFFAFAVLH